MGRELRRKQAKKDGKSLEKEEIVEELQFKRYFIIVIVIVVVLVVLYILSSLFITKELDWLSKDEKEETTKMDETDDILASDIFNQKEVEYYVYFYDFLEKESVITDIVTSKLASTTLYKVNTSSVMNANYVDSTGNKKAKNLNELRVVPSTLIKITDGVITEYYEKNEIINKLS